MKKLVLLIILLLAGFAAGIATYAQSPLLNCEFNVPSTLCVNQQVQVVYVGGASPSATYVWDFDSAVVLSGSGQGPYTIKWETTGVKIVSLHIEWETQTCTWSKEVHVVPAPEVFEMTGGGVYVPGGPGVPVGLSGSEPNIIYKLRRYAEYTGISLVGTGLPLDFPPQTIAGSYNCVAKVDGADCLAEMEGVAIVTILEVPFQHICMVSFDTLTEKNQIIWNKINVPYISHFNIYKENNINNQFAKIAEVPYQNFSAFVDTGSHPLIKSDRYRLSVVDSLGIESEQCPPHKTIHLNISPGIYGFNLIWNHYEGYEYLTYRIFRKFGTEPFELIAEVASNVDSYTDFYTQSGVVTYYIEAVRITPCEPWMKENGFTSSLSNFAVAAPLSTRDHQFERVVIAPNPSSGIIRIDLGFVPEQIISVELCTLQGITLYETSINQASVSINLDKFKAGIYVLRISGENIKIVRKLVKI